jgi:hypothetical protein
MNDPFTADGQITEDHQSYISADDVVCRADRIRDDHSSDMSGDTFVRNDKCRTADPNSYKSRNDSDCEHTNAENHHVAAANTGTCVRASLQRVCHKPCCNFHVLMPQAQTPIPRHS